MPEPAKKPEKEAKAAIRILEGFPSSSDSVLDVLTNLSASASPAGKIMLERAKKIVVSSRVEPIPAPPEE